MSGAKNKADSMVKKVSFSKPNINVTEKAAVHIAKHLAANPDKAGLRFYVERTGCSGYAYGAKLIDVVSDEDHEIDNTYSLAIFVDKASLKYLNGMMVDYLMTDWGQSQLSYINPNEGERCGCGESFTIDEDAAE